MPKHDGWVLMDRAGKLYPETFAVLKAEVTAKRAAFPHIYPKRMFRAIRVKLVPSDPPRRQR